MTTPREQRTDNEIIEELQDLFIGKIMEKNSWGKNEIIALWKDCLIKMLMERIG